MRGTIQSTPSFKRKVQFSKKKKLPITVRLSVIGNFLGGFWFGSEKQMM